LEIVSSEAAGYADLFTPQTDPLLEGILYEAAAHPKAHMLSGRTQGQLLELLSRLVQPLRILEIGTFVGYSALCLAKGLKPEGQLHTIEKSEAEASVARRNFNSSNLGDKIILHQGDALEIIPFLNETWDLVFIDAEKTAYENYYKLVFPALRNGGLIIVDNVLFHGTVLEKELRGKNALAIQKFNEMVSADTRVDKVLLTVRDGLYLIRKK
jgi:predicted O-methyltransferase YrrM